MRSTLKEVSKSVFYDKRVPRASERNKEQKMTNMWLNLNPHNYKNSNNYM